MASTSSQKASTSNSPCSDQIFLSFRGEGTRKNFVDHLYTALNYAGFHTFRDDDGIERGEHIKSELQNAIQESRIALVVLSKNYASSSWCLDELVMIFKCRSTISRYVVLPLFYHVDPSDVRNQLGSFKEVFSEHEKKIEAKSGETKNEWIRKVGEWKGALKEVADLGGMNLQYMADGVVMHRLLQEMGRQIVHQESPKNPGERSRLWNHKVSYKVLRQNKGTSKIQGLVLDMGLLKDNEYSNIMLVNRNHSLEEFLDNSLLSTVGNWLQRCFFGSQNSVGIAQENSNQIALEADAFAKMDNLELLQLNHVQIIGSHENFPKETRWLCWHGFPFQSIPSDFPLEKVVVLEMPHSNLKSLFDRTTCLVLLKTLNLSYSHSLSSTPDFRALPNLERLLLEDCPRLVEIDESIGQLERLILLNLKDCSNLRRLPKSIGMLESLQTLDISGCSNLGNSPTEMGNMDSLPVVGAVQDVLGMSRSPSTIRNVKAQHLFIRRWPLKARKNPEPSWVSYLPRFLEWLDLSSCNLSDNAFPKALGNLSSLQVLRLGNNPITSLPDFVGVLTKLLVLDVGGCEKLPSFVVLQEVKGFSVFLCKSLDKVAFLSPAFAELSTVREQGLWEKTIFLSPTFSSDQEYEVYCIGRKEPECVEPMTYSFCQNLAEISGKIKLEPLENVDEKIINNLGLFNLGSMGNLNGFHEQHVFYTYLPGSNVPGWFNITTKGSLLSFIVPGHNSRIRGLSLCTVYECFPNKFSKFWDNIICSNIVISNTTKRLIWSHCPWYNGIPKDGDHIVWLSYWKFENQVESGDKLNISVYMTKQFQVKQVGVRLLYEVAEAEVINTPQIPSTSEIEQQEVPEEIFR